MKEAGDDEEMVVSKKALQLKKYFETAMSGSDGVDRYIPQFCDGLTKRIEKDYKKHQDEMDKMSRDIVEKICNQGFWVNGKVLGNSHSGNVGRTKDGLTIHKRSSDKSTRIFFVRWTSPLGLTYIRLVGYQLKGERDKGYLAEVEEIVNRYGGVVYQNIEPYVEDAPKVLNSNANIFQTHGKYLFYKDNLVLTQGYVERLLHESNIVVTDEQFEQIAKSTPLLIDGHAGTGKSIVIALRIAMRFYIYHMQSQDKGSIVTIPKLLVVAYSKRVLDMIKEYAFTWMGVMLGNESKLYINKVDFIPTLKLYHSLLSEHHNSQIPDPTTTRSAGTFVNFYRFQKEFFEKSTLIRDKYPEISPEQSWHFIRGVLKGSKLGWHGHPRLTLNDFGSVTNNPHALVKRKSTESMPRELIQSLLEVFYEYEKWRFENKLMDDIDLVRNAINAVDAGESFGDGYIKSYESVLVDEAQDLTIIEFELIATLMKEYSQKVNIVVGGDPLQTINPTGFSWGNLEAFITAKIISVGGKHEQLKSSRMTLSHRMPKDLVTMANVIIDARSKIANTKYKLMDALDTGSNAGLIVNVEFDSEDSKQKELMNSFLHDAVGSNIGAIVWARDSQELISTLSNDDVHQELVNDLLENNNNLDIHSIESVKGLEFDTVILYRFGELSEKFSRNLEQALDPSEERSLDEQYELLYFLNRLFIAITRSKSNLYIIDSKENIDRCWTGKWKTHRPTISLDVFAEDVDTEPTLEKAINYYIKGQEKQDIDYLNRAKTSASRCPNSKDKDDLIDDILIAILKLKKEELGLAREEKKAIVKQLSELYEKKGDWEEGLNLRIEENDWEGIYTKYKNSKVPKINFVWTLSKSNITKKYDDFKDIIASKIIEDKPVGEFEKHTAKNLRKLKNELIRYHILELSPKELSAIKSKYSISEMIDMLSPDWISKSVKSAVENSKLARDFRKKMTDLYDFEKRSSNLTEIQQAKIYTVFSKNPDIMPTEATKTYESLVKLGDKDAVKNAIKKLINDTKPENITITWEGWRMIYKHVNSLSVEYDLDENYLKIRSRLEMIDSIFELSRNAGNKNTYEKNSKQAIKNILLLRNEPDLVIDLNSDHKIGFLRGDANVIQAFRKIINLGSEITEESNIASLLRIISKPIYTQRNNASVFLLWDLRDQQNFIELLKEYNLLEEICLIADRVVDTIVNYYSGTYESIILKNLISCVTVERKNLLRRQPTAFSRDIHKLLELKNSGIDYSVIWQEPGTLKPWVYNQFDEDSNIKVGFHIMVNNWKKGNKNQLEDIVSLIKQGIDVGASPDLIREIKIAAGESTESLLKDLIVEMDVESIRKDGNLDDCMKLIKNSEFTMESLNWSRVNWFSNSSQTIKAKGVKNLEPEKRLIAYAIFSDSFAQAVIDIYGSNPDGALRKWTGVRFFEDLWDKIENRIRAIFNRSRIWELLEANNSMLRFCSMNNPRGDNINGDLIYIAAFDIISTISEMSNMKTAKEYCKEIGLLSKTSFKSNQEFYNQILSTDIFRYFIENTKNEQIVDLIIEAFES